VVRISDAGSKVTTSVLVPGRTRTNIAAREWKMSDPSAAEKAHSEMLARIGIHNPGIEPEETARFTAAAIKRGDFWIFPNEGERERIERRMSEILSFAR
jgi:hypothetical protein